MIKNLVRRALPKPYLDRIKSLRSLYKRSRSFLTRGEYHCPVCRSRVQQFEKIHGMHYGDRERIIAGKTYVATDWETHNVEAYTCPVCGTPDRARLAALYLSMQLSDLHDAPACSHKMIHFAPESGMEEHLRRYKFLDYRSADLYRSSVDEKVDITDMACYEDESVDLLICSHILEHIEDDSKAMSELFRILKKSGWGIIMVPILLPLDTSYEDSSITSEEERMKHFGQPDHVRIYSKTDFVSRLTETGFIVKERDASYFGSTALDKAGVSQQSVLYLVEKRQ